MRWRSVLAVAYYIPRYRHVSKAVYELPGHHYNTIQHRSRTVVGSVAGSPWPNMYIKSWDELKSRCMLAILVDAYHLDPHSDNLSSQNQLLGEKESLGSSDLMFV